MIAQSHTRGISFEKVVTFVFGVDQTRASRVCDRIRSATSAGASIAVGHCFTAPETDLPDEVVFDPPGHADKIEDAAIPPF